MKSLAPPLWGFPRLETFLLTALAFLLSLNSLFGTLAFEFSFFLGLAASLVHALGSSLRLVEVQKSRGLEYRDIRRLVVNNWLSLLPPLLIILIFSGQNHTCRWDIGLAWFVLGPIISSIFGTGCGVWAVYHHRHLKHPIFWALVPIFLFSLLTLHDLWAGPALYFVHPAFGYYPGPIFDEWIPLEPRIFTFRLWTLALSLWLLWPRNSRPLVYRGLGMALLLLFCFRLNFGWSSNSALLQKELPIQIQTDWITLHVSQSEKNSNKAKHLARVFHTRAQQVAQALLLDPTDVQPVHVFLYESLEQKRRLTGTAHTWVGNPIQRSLHLFNPDERTSLVPHELTHVLAAPYGLPGLGLSYRVGLLEGLATAQEKYRGKLTLHEWAKAMLDLSLLPPMTDVMGTLTFYRHAPSRSYLAAGSFCQWLIERKGVAPLLGVYRGASFATVYGLPLKSLVDRWVAFLKTIPPSPAALNYAKPRLMRKAIFRRRCPHDVADAFAQAKTCSLGSNQTGALAWLERAHMYSGKAPNTALALVRSYQKQGDWKKALTLAKATPPSPRLHVAKGDSYFMLSQKQAARASYQSALQQTDYDFARLIPQARLDLLQSGEVQLLGWWLEEGFSTRVQKSMEARSKSIPIQSLTLWLAYRATSEWNVATMLQASHSISLASTSPWYPLSLKLRALMQERLGQIPSARDTYRELFKRGKTQGEKWFARDQFLRLEKL